MAKNQGVLAGVGGRCPKCGKPMDRYRHPHGWLPQPGRNFYEYWDRCHPCGHFQNYSDALRLNRSVEVRP